MQTYKQAKAESILSENVWTRPDNYAGYNPEQEYVISTHHRDSRVLENSNFERISEDLTKKAESLGESDSVYTWRASHWGVGWIEYLMLKDSASPELKEFAGEILIALSEYPVYDESYFSEREYNHATDVWRECYDIKGRIELIKKYGYGEESIFAARRDTPPFCGDIISILCE